MPHIISMYTYPSLTLSSKLYCCIILCGIMLIGMCVNLCLSIDVAKYMFFMTMHMYLSLSVLMVLFHRILLVGRLAVHVVSSNGYVMRLPTAVILTLLGLFFGGSNQ